MQKVLVTGGSGFMGRNFCEYFKDRFEIVALYNSSNIAISGVKCIQTDITDFSKLESVVLAEKPDIVLHTAADSNPNSCEVNKAESWLLNVEATRQLALLSEKYNCKLIFISTDLIFDGNNAPYSENSEAVPICEYGKQKLDAENFIKQISDTALICRIPLMFGKQFDNAKCFIHPMIESLKNSSNLYLFEDEIRNPIEVLSLLKFIFKIQSSTVGVIHIAGEKSYSRFEIGKILALAMKIENPSLIKTKQFDVKMAASRPQDVTLCIDKAKLREFAPQSLKYEISNLVKSN